MTNIINVNNQNLIIKKENETYFFNYVGKDEFKIKQEFMTIDGHDVGVEFNLNTDEIMALAKTLNSIVYDIENEDFVAIGYELYSDIHFKAKNIDEAYQWEHENVGWNIEVLPLSEYEIK